jgi:enoyl-CoA hydratase
MQQGSEYPASVLTEELNGVLVITLNRPEVRNAANAAVAQAVARSIDDFACREDLRVAILTGAGNTFCAGMDLKAFGDDGQLPVVGSRGFLGITNHVLDKPLIAAVEGYALAGGMEAVLACDIVVASREARFGLSEVKRGLVAGAGGLYKLPRKIPINVAMEMALTGEPIGADHAAQLGLVNRLTDPGDALTEARKIASMIVANAPLAVLAGKRIVLAQQDWQQAEALERQREITGDIESSADANEGAAAFVQKRKPQWVGR